MEKLKNQNIGSLVWQPSQKFQIVLELDEMPKVDDDVTFLMEYGEAHSFPFEWDEHNSDLRILAIARLQVDTQDNQLSNTKNNAKPKATFFTTAAYNGIDENFGVARKQTLDGENLYFQTGITLDLPWRSTAKKEIHRDTLSQIFAENMFDTTADSVRLSLDRASRLVKRLQQDLETANTIEDTLKKKYKEDRKQFDAGRIDVDELIRSNDQFTQATLAASKAKYDYLQSIGYYNRVNNTLLSEIKLLSTELEVEEF